jgi:hypothetical protein
MLTKTKIALVAALVAGSASVASAQGFDPNPSSRYPAFAAPGGMAQPYLGLASQAAAPQGTDSQTAYPRRGLARGSLQSAPVALRQGNAAGTAGQSPVYYRGQQQDGFDIDRSDRASSPYAGGVN